MYRYLTGLADALRAAGVPVVEHTGWKTRGRPSSVGEFNPVAVFMHHDASAKGPSPGEPDYIVKGRPEEGDPGPLSNCWVSGGVWHVLAAGRCNHAGLGGPIGPVGKNQGNGRAVGVEWDHTTGEPISDVDHDSIVKGLAGIAKYLKIDPATALFGHLEYAPGRKFDPDPKALPMPQLRKDVAAALRPPGVYATVSRSDVWHSRNAAHQDGCANGYVFAHRHNARGKTVSTSSPTRLSWARDVAPLNPGLAVTGLKLHSRVRVS